MSQRLRKNSKIVKSLFSNPKAVFVLRESHSNQSDGFDYSDKVVISSAEALERFNKWYSDLGCRAFYNENGDLIKVELGEYDLAYWSDRMYVTFEEVTTEIPTLPEEQILNVAQAVANPEEVPTLPTEEEIDTTAITPEDIEAIRLDDRQPKIIEIEVIDGETFEHEIDPLASIVHEEEIRFTQKMREIASNLDLIEKEIQSFETVQEMTAEENIYLTYDQYEETRLKLNEQENPTLIRCRLPEQPKQQAQSKHGIKSVFVEWSESGLINRTLGTNEQFNICKEIPFDVAEKLFSSAAIGKHGSYFKTKVNVIFADGEEYAFRMDINSEEANLTQAFNNRIRYAATRDASKVPEWDRDLYNFWIAFSDKYEIKQA